FLRNDKVAQELAPDLILRFGLQPASKSLLNALNKWNPDRHIYFSIPPERKKTSLPVTQTFHWSGQEFDLKPLRGGQDIWLSQWREAEEKYFDYSSTVTQKIESLTDGHVYQHFAEAIPEEWWIFFSNSFPARDRSMFGHWKAQTVYTNRGVSGIDGINSTHLGIGLGSAKAGILFTGDLAFLHDSNSLLNSRLADTPQVMVILNNRGGSIFRMLPIAEHQAYFTPYFETPQKVDISQLCASHGLPCRTIETVAELNKFQLKRFTQESKGSLHIIECRTDPDASMQLRRKLWMKE
ncbi:MAG: thiamine pyrophosphate-dependent enzyme, partial [Balneolaceae bacterium]|nr:thiamine pyrophosphate-dependent enzyme [Balneolaceae bacterium]